MRVRDAVEADAEAMATIADGPTDVMVNLVHDRTVSVAEPAVDDDPSDGDVDAADDDDEAAVGDVNAGASDASDVADDGSGAAATDDIDGSVGDAPGSDGEEILGFVSYDANESVVHVTQIDGTTAACERLLAEPVRFATEEDMRVELLVTDADGDVATAAERVGFDRNGTGPRFDGETTVRYDLHPD